MHFSRSFFIPLFLSILLAPQLLAQKKGRGFRSIINQAKYHDPYDPRVREGLFVGKIQTGSHADYTTDTIETLYAGYYFSREGQVYLVIPEFEGEYLGLGAEYLIGSPIGDKTWVGVEFYPDDADFKILLRGVNYRSSTAKLHYKLALTLYDEAKAYQFAGGYHTHPFRRSRNTFLDFKGDYRLFDGDLINVANMSLIGEIGHGWANFADVVGLQLYGSVGLEYFSVNVSTSAPGIDDDGSDSDVDMRIVVGILYKTGI